MGGVCKFGLISQNNWVDCRKIKWFLL